MRQSRQLKLGICLILLIILIGGCVILTKINNRNAQIKESFNKTLSLYPTKNLEDFYDKEGFRDQEFEKAIKALGSLILKWLLDQKVRIWNLEEWCSI